MAGKRPESNIPPSGTFAAPPPGAPQETASGVPAEQQFTDRDGRVLSAASLAAQFEQPEPVFAPRAMTREQQIALIGRDAVERAEMAEGVAGVAGRPAGPSGLVDPGGRPLSAEAAAPPAVVVGLPQVAAEAAAPEPVFTSSFRAPDVKRSPRERPSIDVAAEQLLEQGITPTATNVLPSATAQPTDTADLAPAVPLPTGDAPPAQTVGLDGTMTPVKRHQPAASDSDSPSRGMPKPVNDPGKQITGGFGDVGEAQYFPLDGLELKALVNHQLERLSNQLDHDLRFGIAAVYPRVNVRVVLEVDCYVTDQSFEIPKMMIPHERTPLEVAREMADHVVFCVLEEHVEMLPDGESVTPPNALRHELGLEVPAKRAVQTPGGRMLVDRL